MRHALVLLVLLTACSSGAQRPEASLLDLGVLAQADTETASPPVGSGWRGAGPAEPRRVDAASVRTPVDPPATRVTEDDIRRALTEGREARSRAVRFPLRVVAVEIAAGGESGVQARPLAAGELDTLRGAFEKEPLVDRIDTIPSLFLPVRPDLPNLRYQAARFGGDVLLLLTRGTNTYDYVNGWGILYPTIVGLFLAPGQSIEIWTAAEAALIDVADGRPLAVVEADARLDAKRLLLSDDTVPRRELLEESQESLLATLGERLEERLIDLGRGPGLSGR